MNRIIKLLLLSEIFVQTGFGLIDPILAIFIKEDLIGGTIFAAGLASSLYLVTKCTLQLPFARYVDTHDNKIKWLIIGMLINTTVPFLYMSANHINIIYLAQFIFGIGSALTYPTWLGLWSRHLDKNHESFEWSLYSTLTGLGTAATATIGAATAEFLGFRTTFALVGILNIIGALVLIYLELTEHPKDKKHHKQKEKTVLYRK